MIKPLELETRKILTIRTLDFKNAGLTDEEIEKCLNVPFDIMNKPFIERRSEGYDIDFYNNRSVEYLLQILEDIESLLHITLLEKRKQK